MPFTAADIVATPGAPDANSYVSLAAFTAANERELVADSVSAATDDTAARALVQATARLDEERFIGAVASDAQALQWPREEAVDSYGVTWPAETVPRPVERATILLARYYLERRAADVTADAGAPDDDRRVKRIAAGEVEVEFTAPAAPNATAASPLGGDIPDAVLRALLGLVITPGQAAALASPGAGTFAFSRA